MPDKVIAVEGLGNVAFPDTMSDDDISAAIQKQLGTGPKGITAGQGKTGMRLKSPKGQRDPSMLDWFPHAAELGENGFNPDATLGTLSDMGKFIGTSASPTAVGPALAHPVRALVGAGVGLPVQQGLQRVGEMLGFPGTGAAVGDVAGMVAGGLASQIPSVSGLIREAHQNPEMQKALIDLIPYWGSRINKIRGIMSPESPAARPSGPIPSLQWPSPGGYGSTQPAPTVTKAAPIPPLRGSSLPPEPPAPKPQPVPPLRGSSLPPEPPPVKPQPVPPLRGSSLKPEPVSVKHPIPPLRWNPKPTEEAVPAPVPTSAATPIQPVANAPVTPTAGAGGVQVESLAQQKFHDKSGSYIGQKNIALMDRFFTDPEIKSGNDVRSMSKATFDSHLQKTVNPETGKNYTATKTGTDLPKGRMGRSFEAMREEVAQQYDEFLRQAGK